MCPFFRLSKLMFKSPIMSVFSYFLATLHNDLLNSIKNVALLLIYGGLQPNVKHNFLFDMVISLQIASSFNIYILIFQNSHSYKPFFYTHNFSATIFIMIFSKSEILVALDVKLSIWERFVEFGFIYA